MPRVDVSEAILEVLGWCPAFLDSLTSLSGGQAHLADLDISVAACLTAQALNITYAPIAAPGVPALARHRLGYVEHTFLPAENYTAANPHLVAAIDGMRFVVPVPSAYARPNKKYFGQKRGVTWLNMITDQAMGIGAKVVSGNRSGLPARFGCRVRFRAIPARRCHHHRHGIVFGPGVWADAFDRPGIPSGAGGFA